MGWAPNSAPGQYGGRLQRSTQDDCDLPRSWLVARLRGTPKEMRKVIMIYERCGGVPHS